MINIKTNPSSQQDSVSNKVSIPKKSAFIF